MTEHGSLIELLSTRWTATVPVQPFIQTLLSAIGLALNLRFFAEISTYCITKSVPTRCHKRCKHHLLAN